MEKQRRKQASKQHQKHNRCNNEVKFSCKIAENDIAYTGKTC